MIDFLMISTRPGKKGIVEIYPKFIIKKSSDLMIRGGDFYAVWIEEKGFWSTEEQDLIDLVDRELDKYAEENRNRFDSGYKVLHMWDSDTRMIDNWHHYCQRCTRDSFHMLDEKIIFADAATNKKDYASKKLSYPLEEGSIDSYDKLISTLYSEKERHKIEWAIGAIVTGDSKKLQKFMVLYGAAGTGKSTIINIIQKLFDGYCAVFDAKALGSSSNAFALEAFKTNPLVAIQHDGDLSRIEDNTRINSLVSHEMMTVNEKFKPGYSNSFKAFLIMGTNKPVKITDAKSGIIRRLIDVSPSGNKLSPKEYRKCVKQIDFELGAIAYHCREVYLSNPHFYDDYIPEAMLSATNDFYNYVMDNYYIFKKEDSTTLKAAYEMYNVYCDQDHARVAYPMPRKAFQEELKNYFDNFEVRHRMPDGTRARNYYSGFNADKYAVPEDPPEEDDSTVVSWLDFKEQESIFDKDCSSCFAQYATESGAPKKAWDNVSTTLSSLDTSKLHYVRLPSLNHIIIDFDIPGPDGKKDFNKNFEEASKWPPNYAELSRSGGGIHLHYIYSGDPEKLSAVYDDHIEVKVYSGKGALRRKLSKCNNIPIATISSGLPLRGDMKLVNFEAIKSEKALRTLISRNLNKEYHANTTQSINFIHKILEDAYNSDLRYDVSDMYNAVLSFAVNSTHQSEYCIKTVCKMHFKSEEPSEYVDPGEAPIAFYDVEVFPNLFLVNWKIQGEGNPVVRMINPGPKEIERILKFRLVGFNNRRYDNHMLYARLIGYSNEQLYILSQKIVKSGKKEKCVNENVFFAQAYNLSYADIYDFSSVKQSLKKFEIELKIHHQELGLPWDKPVPEEMWEKVAEYCDNDVLATEAVWNSKDRKADFVAREILAEVAGSNVNDTTNGLTGKIIFGKNKHPQSQFNYRDMGNTDQKLYKSFVGKDNVLYDASSYDEYTVFTEDGKPIFPGYRYLGGKSSYRGEEIGEGGYVYTEPGIYVNVALLDIASMHPSTIMAEELFGPEYTKRFGDILQTRIYIKHKEFDKAREMMGGCFAKYLDDPKMAKTLSKALKIPINSVYGLTSAHFDNLFRDKRNVDNIVAKRGELFMINLKHEVKKRGFTVAHIKTDSIKIPNATPEIIKFVMDYGKMYGYNFEHETTYERMCLVNKSVYIARHATEDFCKESYGYIPGDISEGCGGQWTATGDQFAVPYVYKTLFTHEDIVFDDMCETMSVSDAALYLDMNENFPDVENLEKLLDLRRKNPNKKTRREVELLESNRDISDEELEKLIAGGHSYHFVGKIGQFTPVTSGGGVLYRGVDDNGIMRYSSANGAKGFRWMESEMVRVLHKEDLVDRSYYDKLVDAAIATIRKYETEFRTFEWFVSGEEIPDFPVDEPTPF